MNTLFQNAEVYREDLEYLLAHTDRQKLYEKVKRHFRRSLGATKKSIELLEAIEKEQDETLWTKYEHWSFDDPWTDPNFLNEMLDIFQFVATQLESDEISEIIGSLRLATLDYSQRKRELDKRILASWRKKHPYFSSMGILDTAIDISSGREVQSDTLKDLKALDRR